MNLGLLLPKHFRQEKPTLLPWQTPTLGGLVMTILLPWNHESKAEVYCTVYNVHEQSITKNNINFLTVLLS